MLGFAGVPHDKNIHIKKGSCANVGERSVSGGHDYHRGELMAFIQIHFISSSLCFSAHF